MLSEDNSIIYVDFDIKDMKSTMSRNKPTLLAAILLPMFGSLKMPSNTILVHRYSYAIDQIQKASVLLRPSCCDESNILVLCHYCTSLRYSVVYEKLA
jgi:hypothetical protein